MSRTPLYQLTSAGNTTEQVGESDLVVRWRQAFPIRLTLNVDDSGSRWTGQNQGSVTVSVDNPLGLSDLFYAHYDHDLGHKKRVRDPVTGSERSSGTRGYGFSYSVPWGNGLIAYSFGYSEYRQAVAGFATSYLYWGTSEVHDVSLKRHLYRDARRKGVAGVGIWGRSGHNYIDDAELSIQHRRTAGWQAEIEHTEYVGEATLRALVRYRHGTGAFASRRAPEESLHEGTSRMRFMTSDLSLGWPFRVAEQTLALSSQLHVQFNDSRLTSQDKLSIGGRHTVRGFDGEVTLMGERGYFWRNELAWHFRQGHQVYGLFDAGEVGGPSTRNQLGTALAGYGVGLRGQLQAGGSLYYDLFSAWPMRYPSRFPTRNPVLGFSVSGSF